MATRELSWEVTQAKPRTLTVLDNYAIEVGDLVQLPEGSKLWVESWSKTIGREQMPLLEIHGYRCPAGV